MPLFATLKINDAEVSFLVEISIADKIQGSGYAQLI